MADSPDWDHIGRLIRNVRDVGFILGCVPLSDMRTLDAAYIAVHECEKRGADVDTHRHAAEVLLQGFMQATDNGHPANSPKIIHLGALRIIVREALRRIMAARTPLTEPAD